MAMPAGASKRLKQHALRRHRLWLRWLHLSRAFSPQPAQRFDCRLQFIAREMNRQKREHEMKAVRIAAKQNEVVVVAEGRKPRFARVWQVPSPSRDDALREDSALLQMACKNNVRLD